MIRLFLEALQNSRFSLFDVSAVSLVARADSFATPAGGRRNSGFIFVKDGQCRYCCQEPFSLGAGDLAYLPAGSHYTFNVLSKPLNYTLVNYTMRDESGQSLCLAELPLQVAEVPSAFYRLKTDALIQATLQDGVSRQLECAAHLYALFASLLHDLAVQSLDRLGYAAIVPAIRYLEKNYAAKLTTDELAKLCRLSPSQLRRLFHRCLGLSPMAYKNQLRIRQASILLAASHASVGEIADQLGFADIFTFSTLYKKMTGQSPRALRTGQFPG
jgi:AraC-like DNA-binding protein